MQKVPSWKEPVFVRLHDSVMSCTRFNEEQKQVTLTFETAISCAGSHFMCREMIKVQGKNTFHPSTALMHYESRILVVASRQIEIF